MNQTLPPVSLNRWFELTYFIVQKKGLGKSSWNLECPLYKDQSNTVKYIAHLFAICPKHGEMSKHLDSHILKYTWTKELLVHIIDENKIFLCRDNASFFL